MLSDSDAGSIVKKFGTSCALTVRGNNPANIKYLLNCRVGQYLPDFALLLPLCRNNY
jgi:hypothetical protein